MDYIVCCSYNPQLEMYVLALMYDLKDGLLVPPAIYLGADIKEYKFKSGKSHCSMSST